MAEIDPQQASMIEKLQTMIEPVLRAEGKELVEIEFRREAHGWVLRLFIDQQEGINVDDCAQVSHVVGDLLDVADLIRMPYHLEVSSPGLNRPLRRAEHFEKVLGKVIEVRTIEPQGRRRNFKGILQQVDEDQVTIVCDGEPFSIPLLLVERARLCYFDSIEI